MAVADAPRVELRPVATTDLDAFFAYGSDPVAVDMAAFTARDPSDRAAFDAHWARILADPTTVNYTIVADGAVAGSVAAYGMGGAPEVTYWLGREFWGRGIATAALRLLLEEVAVRPLAARVVKDNIGSLRVLERCGFVITGEGTGYAAGRGKEAEEFILSLKGESLRSY